MPVVRFAPGSSLRVIWGMAALGVAAAGACTQATSDPVELFFDFRPCAERIGEAAADFDVVVGILVRLGRN